MNKMYLAISQEFPRVGCIDTESERDIEPDVSRQTKRIHKFGCIDTKSESDYEQDASRQTIRIPMAWLR